MPPGSPWCTRVAPRWRPGPTLALPHAQLLRVPPIGFPSTSPVCRTFNFSASALSQSHTLISNWYGTSCLFAATLMSSSSASGKRREMVVGLVFTGRPCLLAAALLTASWRRRRSRSRFGLAQPDRAARGLYTSNSTGSNHALPFAIWTHNAGRLRSTRARAGAAYQKGRSTRWIGLLARRPHACERMEVRLVQLE
jgi:hypothetical protein